MISSYLSQIAAVWQFSSGISQFLHEPLSADAARVIIRGRLEQRPQHFLTMIERVILGNPASPYLRLLQSAGCELGDIKHLVAQDGVEGTLCALRDAGIYVSYDEFKGRQPIRRGSQTFPVAAHEFDNPLIRSGLRSTTGGSRGGPTRIVLSLDQIAQTAPHWAVWFDAHGWMDRLFVLWMTEHAGIVRPQLRCAKFGKSFVKWFAAGTGGTLADRVIAFGLHQVIRRAARFPRADPVRFNQPERVCDYLDQPATRQNRVCLYTSPSAAVRVSELAQTRRISLTHVAFLLGGEPVTPTRKELIETSGARAFATYGCSEAGSVAAQCPQPRAADDVHVFRDAFAVIPFGIDDPEGARAEALAITALLPTNSKIMLNTLIGDYGVIQEKECACAFGALGYSTHLHTVRSFEKLTAEGATILGGDVLRVMEQVLPARFGGTALDYQFVEEQNAQGLFHYTLRIDPAVGPLDEQECVRTLIDAVSRGRGDYRLMTRLWAQAANIRVLRAPPQLTARGKILPFRTFRSG